jgi:hypothetical protein
MDKKELSALIMGDDPAKVEKWFKLFEDPVWIPKYNVSWTQCRDEPMEKLKKVS